MEESNFDRLLERYAAGQATPQEMKKIEAWFEVRKTKGEENVGLNREEEEMLFQKITSNIDNEEEIRAIRPIESASSGRRIWVLGIAASLLFLIVSSVAFFYREDVTRLFASNGTDKIILSDGSIVWLRGNSKFSYYESAEDGSRHGELTGEALFEIAKDPLHPFTIAYGQFTITVVGTSFNLRTLNDSLELKVLTGKVRLANERNTEGIIVKPREVVRIAALDSITTVPFSSTELVKITANTQYDMDFSNVPMATIAQRLSAKFDIEVSFSNEKINNCLVTADFTDHSIESTARMLADALNGTFTKDGNKIRIEAAGCD